MCGIIGYAGKNSSARIMVGALRRLDYRGYDSAGVATVFKGEIEVRKGPGDVSTVEENVKMSMSPGSVGIGHTRWATHGEASEVNAHPHTDCTGKIAIVHNGIITNYGELRDSLEADGHNFKSETDSEVIAHLLEDGIAQGMSFSESFRKTMLLLEGTYAIAAICSISPMEIMASRRGSPLVVGVYDLGVFVASDALSFTDHTDKVIFPEDGDIIEIQEHTGVTITDSSGNDVEREIIKTGWKWEDATSAGYDHYMLKEIHEQPEAIIKTLEQPEKTIKQMAMAIQRARQVIFVACGTSQYAALVGKYAFSKMASVASQVLNPSEFDYFTDSIDPGTVIIALSQSGETADVMQIAAKAKEAKATLLSIVNVPGSSLDRMSDINLYLKCGPEVSVAATKTFTAQLTVLYMLAHEMIDEGEVGRIRLRSMAQLLEANHLTQEDSIKRIANYLKDKEHVFFLGRGVNYAIAMESALKLKEISYIHAEGLPAGELKHGTLSLIEPGTPVIAINPPGETHDATITNLVEVSARGGYIIGICEFPHNIYADWVTVPPVPEIVNPIVSMVPPQLIAYYTAIARGLNPDRPRNLAKSVTVL